MSEFTELKDSIANIDKKVDRMMNLINNLKERNDDIGKDISKIKDNLYDPNDGLFTKVRDLDSQKHITSGLNIDMTHIKDPETGLYVRTKALEAWKETYSKVTWVFFSTILVVVAKQLWDLIV
jgi:chromosome segregation ATPase